jgi:hypothetical protein
MNAAAPLMAISFCPTKVRPPHFLILHLLDPTISMALGQDVALREKSFVFLQHWGNVLYTWPDILQDVVLTVKLGRFGVGSSAHCLYDLAFRSHSVIYLLMQLGSTDLRILVIQQRIWLEQPCYK